MNRQLVLSWAATVKTRQWRVREAISPGQTRRMLDLLNGVLKKPLVADVSNSLHKGFHFIYILQNNLQLGPDGYDNEQAPLSNGEGIYKRRMWVRGSIEFHNPLTGRDFEATEIVQSVRPINDSVLVTIRKELFEQRPILTETRSLIYTNEQYLAANRKTALSKETPDNSTTVKLSPTDLLKYSMLTSNLHKIHYDKKYAVSENLPDIVVHGPFMVSLVLYWFAGLHSSTPKSFKYKNMEPCFAEEEMTIQCTQTTKDTFHVCIINIAQGKRYLDGVLEC